MIELLVTLVILALLATAATPMLQLSAKRERETELRRALWQIRDAIDAYKQASDDGLIAHSVDKSGYPPSLEILVTGVENSKDAQHHKIFFLRQIPRDPFYPDRDTPAEQTWKLRSYTSSFDESASDESASSDGPDVYDVHSTSSAKSLDGRPYREW